MKRLSLVLAIMAFALFVSGCSSEGSKSASNYDSQKPIAADATVGSGPAVDKCGSCKSGDDRCSVGCASVEKCKCSSDSKVNCGCKESGKCSCKGDCKCSADCKCGADCKGDCSCGCDSCKKADGKGKGSKKGGCGGCSR